MDPENVNIMYEPYQFSEESAAHLQRFLDAVATQPEPQNKWSAYFNTPQFPDSEKQPLIIEIDPSPDDISAVDIPTAVLEENQNSINARNLCEFVENACQGENLLTIFEEVSAKIDEDIESLSYLAKNLSESAVSKFMQCVSEKSPSDIFVKRIFIKFILPLVKSKPHTRFVDSLVLESHKNYPEVFTSTFLADFLNEPRISADVFDHYAKSLALEEKRTLLNEVFTIPFSGEQFLLHIPAIIGLYKTLDDSFIKASIIKLLCTYSEVASGDKNYGKLLLAVIQNTNGSSAQLDVLESLCMVHQTVFRKACLNALNKVRNR